MSGSSPSSVWPSLPRTAITASKGWAPVRLGELWDYRELLYFLVWREIKVRYKQTALGVAWAVLQPVLTMVVFSIVFGRLAGLPSEGVPYPIFTFCALLPWQLFSLSLTQASNSVVANQALITKVYFPRVLVPLASIGVGIVDFVVAFAVLLGMMAFYGIVPGVALLTVPLWALLAVFAALAMALWLSALNVRYRDVRYALPFLAQVWLFATPVAYATSIVPEEWRGLYALNPMVGVVDGFRWALLGLNEPPDVTVAVSSGVTLLAFITGLMYFRRTERTFADII